MELTQEQKGKIGETAVMLELLKKGFNVININNSYPNYKNADYLHECQQWQKRNDSGKNRNNP